MKYLVTGGAGFIGANLSIALKLKYPAAKILALDNLKRRGSELNLGRLKHHGIEFIHGDIRNPEDLLPIGPMDTIIECSAEPSVLAGYTAPDYLVRTNLVGTLNCLNYAGKYKADFIFLSTSRVYPVKTINSLHVDETETRFELTDKQQIPGANGSGIDETFPLDGVRSLYGTTKLASELLIQEYAEIYNFKYIINRCGIIAGPWQFGKADQGVIPLWIARHLFRQPLHYIGFGGEGKQVRDILHIDDLFDLIDLQLQHLNSVNGEIFNIGGGREVSVSLLELTHLCQKHIGRTIPITGNPENRPSDIKLYLSNTGKVKSAMGWEPKRTVDDIIADIYRWMSDEKDRLGNILS